jgi:hypothetical protein
MSLPEYLASAVPVGKSWKNRGVLRIETRKGARTDENVSRFHAKAQSNAKAQLCSFAPLRENALSRVDLKVSQGVA